MITSYKKLTGRYLKSNKKRSILTIIGIVLSVALITTIGFFMVGMQDAEIERVKSDYGSWHVMYSAPDKDLIAKVTGNPKISRSGLYQMDKDIKINADVSVSSITASDSALELLPYKIKMGRFPENAHEAAVENWVLRYMKKDIKVGDKIELNNRKYTLVGILQDSVSSQIEKKGVFLSKNNSIDRQKSVLLAEISSKTNLKRAVSELDGLPKYKTIEVNGKISPSVVNNSPLIDVEGGGNSNESGLTSLYGTVAVIIGIVLIAAIAVIYNSFQISVVERMKQFGLLRAIGATPSQIRKIVLREASALSIIGIPVGLICGIIAIWAIGFGFKIIGGDMVSIMKVSISPEIMLISAAVSIAAIYVSALLPALLAGKTSTLAAISGRTSITKEKIKRRKNIIISKLFKFEGELAYKNIKRNRKRYRITVFSIVISVVLFITFKSFMDMSLNVSEGLSESSNIHFSIQSNGENSFVDNQIIKYIGELDSVDKMYKVYNEYNFTQFIDKNKEIGEVKNIKGIYGKGTTIDEKEKIPMDGAIGIYDKNALQVSKKYVQSGSIDINKLNDENGVILINKNIIYNKEAKKSYVGPAANIKAGDEIELQYGGETNIRSINNSNEVANRKPVENKGVVKRVKVMAVLKDEPFDFNMQNGLKLITTEEVAEKLTGRDNIKPTGLNIIVKNIKNENNVKDQIENIIKSDPALSMINHLDQNRTAKSAILMIKILIYGFVVVVSLIGSVNIINTLTTNIILRRKEFAILKAVGLTQRGLKKMIVLEGLLYAVVGTIYGSIISCGLSYMMYRGINGVREFSWPVPWGGMLIAAVAAVIIGYFSVLSPLSRINRENLIDTIREDY